jgi:hypothetical protein
LKQPSSPQYETVNWQLIQSLRQLSVPEKNKRAFAAADFALRQKKLILAEENPAWPPEKVANEARRQVFGISGEKLP